MFSFVNRHLACVNVIFWPQEQQFGEFHCHTNDFLIWCLNRGSKSDETESVCRCGRHDRPPERLRQADVENSSPMRTGVTQAYENLCTVLHFSQLSVFHKLLTTKRPFDFKNSIIHKRAISFLFQL